MQAMARLDNPLSPTLILEDFKERYYQVYGRRATVDYLGRDWYRVNNESIHRVTLLNESERLRDLLRAKSAPKPPAPLLVRFIDRLRRL
jgi:hypothetical protein